MDLSDAPEKIPSDLRAINYSKCGWKICGDLKLLVTQNADGKYVETLSY
jgi:hypothetical protein